MSKASKSKRKALATRNARVSMSQSRRPAHGTSDRSAKPGKAVAAPTTVAAPVALGAAASNAPGPRPAEPSIAALVSPPRSAFLEGEGSVAVAAAPSSRGSGLEEAFFREGHRLNEAHRVHQVSFEREMHGIDEVRSSRHAQPNAIARRARLRRVFAGVMGFASVLTVVVTAKAFARHAEAASAPMDTSLILPQMIVASIDLDAPPAEGSTSETTAPPTSGNATGEVSGGRVQRQPTW